MLVGSISELYVDVDDDVVISDSDESSDSLVSAIFSLKF